MVILYEFLLEWDLLPIFWGEFVVSRQIGQVDPAVVADLADVIPDLPIGVMELAGKRDAQMGASRLVLLHAMDTFDRDLISSHGFLLKQKKGSLGVNQTARMGIN
jgi:hypothetical protein